MFDKEFFPTPVAVIEQMGIDCYNKVCLEPSAGKGDIVKWLKANGADDVLACEKQPELRRITSTYCNVIADDFFSLAAPAVSHIQMVVMNPPFSNGAEHILHAWKIAPEGCEIVALCNWETVNKSHWGSNKTLSAVIRDYGEAMNLGDCFRQAERQTGVEVGLIRLFKPVVSDSVNMDGFYLQADEEAISGNGIIPFNELKGVVNSYLAAVRCFEKVEAIGEELYAYTHVSIVTGEGEDVKTHKLEFGKRISFAAGYDENITTKSDFAKAYQKECWQFIFRRIGIEKYVTRGVMADVNQFIESRKNYPFTLRNIGRMLDIIIGTREQTMQRAIVEAVDNFTQHTHENRHGVEGWKTNSGHLLNKKFIVGWIASPAYSGGMELRTYQCSNVDAIVDLIKAVCFVTGKRFEDIQDVYSFRKVPPNTWTDWGFFEFKVFKKGTGHFKFKDLNDWAALNRAYAKIKGQVLPEKL